MNDDILARLPEAKESVVELPVPGNEDFTTIVTPLDGVRWTGKISFMFAVKAGVMTQQRQWPYGYVRRLGNGTWECCVIKNGQQIFGFGLGIETSELPSFFQTLPLCFLLVAQEDLDIVAKAIPGRLYGKFVPGTLSSD